MKTIIITYHSWKNENPQKLAAQIKNVLIGIGKKNGVISMEFGYGYTAQHFIDNKCAIKIVIN